MAFRAWDGIIVVDLYEHEAAIMWETMGCEDCRDEGDAAERFDGIGVELELGKVSRLQVTGSGITNIPERSSLLLLLQIGRGDMVTLK